jgi:hypothetical protein
MSRGAQTFKQGDVTKAIKALVRSGAQGHVEMTRDGKIRVIVTSVETRKPDDEWD